MLAAGEAERSGFFEKLSSPELACRLQVARMGHRPVQTTFDLAGAKFASKRASAQAPVLQTAAFNQPPEKPLNCEKYRAEGSLS